MNNETQTVVAFPEIRALMARYGKNQQDMAGVCSIYYTTFAKKINNSVDFTLTEMLKIRAFFIGLGENPEELTMERLFFAWKIHYSEEG